MGRGVRGRKRIVDSSHAKSRAVAKPGGEDIFSQLCRASYEDGSLLSTAGHRRPHELSDDGGARHPDIIDDITHLVLAKNPQWQERLREEAVGLISAGRTRRGAVAL